MYETLMVLAIVGVVIGVIWAVVAHRRLKSPSNGPVVRIREFFKPDKK